jgi:hypothetical protein
MEKRHFLNNKLGILVILVVILLCIKPSLAACIVEHQGDPVFLNETCDISKVVSWSGDFAYFSSGYESDTPTKIVHLQGFMYKTFIDPKKFVIGDWFKWEGVGTGAHGNNLAFKVMPGVRPNGSPKTNTTQLPNQTILPLVDNKTPNIVVARGEILNYIYPTNEDKGGAWMWLFEGSNLYLGMPMTYTDEGYTYLFDRGTTQYFQPDTYTAYIQFGGYNRKQDVYYSNNAIQSIYRDVNPVYLSGNYSKVQYVDLFVKRVTNDSYSDDTIVPIKFTIEEPNIIIKQYYRDGDTIIIQGTTSLSLGTKISCIIDPTHWTTTSEIRQNTYAVNVTGDTDKDREFIVSLPLKWEELSIGEHNIVLSAKTGLIDLTIHKEFRVSDTYVIPTPTPVKVKVALDENGKPLVTAVPSQTPLIPTLVPVNTIPVTTKTPVPRTPTPTASIVPTKTPVPKSTMITLPFNPVLVLIALGLVCVYTRRKKNE